MNAPATPAPREYMGVLLSPAYGTAARNGFRWQCHIEAAGFLYADTLAGIKRLVRDALAAALERRNTWSLYERRAGGVIAYLGTAEGGLSTIERDYGQRARRIDKRNLTVWL